MAVGCTLACIGMIFDRSGMRSVGLMAHRRPLLSKTATRAPFPSGCRIWECQLRFSYILFGVREKEFGFCHDVAVDSGHALELAQRRPSPQDDRLDLETVAGSDGPTKSRLFHAGKERNLAAIVFAAEGDASHLGHRFENQHPRHDRLIRVMPRKVRLIDRDALDPYRPAPRLDSDDPIDHQHRVPMRQSSKNVERLQAQYRGLLAEPKRAKACSPWAFRLAPPRFVPIVLAGSKGVKDMILAARYDEIRRSLW